MPVFQLGVVASLICPPLPQELSAADLAGKQPKALILTDKKNLARQHQGMVLRYGQGVVGTVKFMWLARSRQLLSMSHFVSLDRLG